MDRQTYEYIWRNTIEPNLCRIEQSFGDENGPVLLKRDSYNVIKEKLISGYDKKKERLKKLYHYDDGAVDRKIDCHKIAACFAAVIIEDKIFQLDLDTAIDRNKEITDDEYLANARLAYHVSLGIVFIDLAFQYCYNNKMEQLEGLLKQEELRVPPTNPGHDTYNLGREKTLALNDVFDNEFDVLTYSDMMFWIEYYNRQILENAIILEAFEKHCDILDDEL